MNSVLILDANQRSALAVTRSLGARGIKITTADCTPTALAGVSRYSSSYVQHPSASDDATGFIDCVVDICKQQDISLIYPMTELCSALLLKHRSKLPDIILPIADETTINQLADKCQLMQLAESLHIPIPGTIQCTPQQLETVDFSKLDYPLVLKPGLSWLEHKQKWLHTTVRFAENQSQAESIIADDPAFSIHPFMIQKCVAGHGEGVFAIYNQGKAIAFFAHQRLREKPPRGGVSVLSESTEVDPQLKKYAQQLLDHTHWHGVAMVEFKVDDDGTAYLMEINTRFWGSLQLAIDAGVDFPWLLHQISTGKDIPPIKHYSAGKRLRWILGDLDSLYLTLRDNNFSVKHKAYSLIRFFMPHPFNTRHEVNRLSDIRPFFWEIKQYLNDLSR